MHNEHAHLFPIFESNKFDNIVPAATFVAKKMIALKKSLVTANDADEIIEIKTMLLFHQSALLLLCLSFLTEENELTDLAKEIFRN